MNTVGQMNTKELITKLKRQAHMLRVDSSMYYSADLMDEAARQLDLFLRDAETRRDMEGIPR